MKRIKINILLIIYSVLSVLCDNIFWTCNTDYPLDSPKARAVLSNPLTHSILSFWRTPLPSFFCSVFSIIVLVYLFKQAIDHETNKLAKIAYWEFFGLKIPILLYHLATFKATFFVE